MSQEEDLGKPQFAYHAVFEPIVCFLFPFCPGVIPFVYLFQPWEAC